MRVREGEGVSGGGESVRVREGEGVRVREGEGVRVCILLCLLVS